MEIKNEALKSLYEKLVSDIWSFSIEVAFKKCDDELEKEKEKLMKDLEDNVLTHYKIKQLEGENEELRKKCTYFEKLSTERLKATEELHQQLDTAEKEREAIREESLRNIREGYKTECDLKELRQKYDYLDRSHKRLGDIRNRLAKENEDLKQQNYTLGQKCQAETNTREYWRLLSNGRGEKICKLMRENAELQRQIDILKQRDMVFVDLDSVKLKGMEELWAMIREVNIAPIEALYGSGAFNNKICVGTIVNMYPDVRDFVKEYKTWKNGKEDKDEEKNKQKCLDEMRDYLHTFCENRWCDGCPLSTDEFKCGRGYRFRKWCFPDNGAIPDEDLKRYYEKVRDWEKKEEKPSDEVPCSFNWKLDGTEFTIETSIPRADYDNIVKIISGKE